MQMLQTQKTRNQARRGGGSPCSGREKPIPLALEKVPIEQLLQPNQFIIRADEIDQQAAIQIRNRLNAFLCFKTCEFTKKLYTNYIKAGKF